MPTKIVKDDVKPKFRKYYKIPCNNLEHNPPSMIVIPQGSKLIHTCPSCGKTVTIYPAPISCRND